MSYFGQVSIKDMFQTALQYLRSIAQPSTFDIVNNGIRTVSVSGTITTVATVSNLVQFNGFDTRLTLTELQENNTWGVTVRPHLK